MSTAELKDLQRPIKDRYRDDAETAQITLEADGTLDDDIACSVQTGKAIVKAGLHPGIGGDGNLAAGPGCLRGNDDPIGRNFDRAERGRERACGR